MDKQKAYYEVSFKSKDSTEWGFTCGYCGRAIDSKKQKTYWKLRNFDFVNDAFNLACSEKCAQGLLKESMWEFL